MPIMTNLDTTRASLNEALAYLAECNIYVPKFTRRYRRSGILGIGGSGVTETDNGILVELGVYPTSYSTNWFVMHELGHVLVAYHRPLRNKRFCAEFGTRQPATEIYNRLQKYCVVPTAFRSRGYASMYGEKGGGEEHFCELLAFMYVSENGFAGRPEKDLAKPWRIAWNDGLALMNCA